MFKSNRKTDEETIFEIVKALIENGPQSYSKLKNSSVTGYIYFKKRILKCISLGLIMPIESEDRKIPDYGITEKGRKYYDLLKDNPQMFRITRK